MQKNRFSSKVEREVINSEQSKKLELKNLRVIEGSRIFNRGYQEDILIKVQDLILK